MKRTLKAALILLGLVLAAGAWGIVSLLRHGLSAREQPTRTEAFVARHLRHLGVPRAARDARSPVPPTPEALARARSHFADHCASCHGNDGRGRTTLGQNLYPKAPAGEGDQPTASEEEQRQSHGDGRRRTSARDVLATMSVEPARDEEPRTTSRDAKRKAD